MASSVSLIHHHNSLFNAASTPPPRCSCLHSHCRLPTPPPPLPYPTKRSSIRCSADRRELFSRIAPVYDNLNDLLSFGQHRVWKKMCVSWSGAKKGDVVLDLCCGSGDLAFLLSQKVGLSGEMRHNRAKKKCRENPQSSSHPRCSLLSLRRDLRHCLWRQQLQVPFTAPEAPTLLLWQHVWYQSRFLMARSVEPISPWWIEGDALNLLFEDSCFDAITIGYGLRNLIDKQKAMQEIFRVLKPGSSVSILDFNKSTSSSITQFQEWAIDNVVVPVASTYGLSEEYKYLKSSIAEFFTGKELEKLAREVGFSDARHYQLAGGLMGDLVATR